MKSIIAVILSIAVSIPVLSSAQQDKPELRRVHVIVGVGTLPRNPTNRLEYLRYSLTGELGIPALAISLDVNARQSALDAGAYMFIDKVSVSERLVDALALALR